MSVTHLGQSRIGFSYKRSAIFLAVSMSSMLLAGNSQAQPAEPEIEEVIVTGSFIRRSEGLNAASPVTSFSAEDLEAQGTVNMAQVVQNLTFNNGTAVTNSIQGVTSTTSNFNLRGLGPRATLTLIDGKRIATDNVQSMLPASALQRMEVVTDGAAALYGSDAVAGVVNLIPYTSYDGIKVEYFEEGDSRGDYRKAESSFLMGQSFDSVDLVFAGSFVDAGALEWGERPDYVKAGLTHNGGSNPGNFLVPNRNANGDLLTTSRSRPDPACGFKTQADQVSDGNNAWGNPALGRCFFSFGDTRDFQPEFDTASLYGNMNWEINDDTTFRTQVMWNRQLTRNRNNTGNPGARSEDLPVVRGELPGNNFRAKTSTGVDLFAAPRRDSSGNIVLDGYGRPVPLRNAAGAVVLANNRFASIANDPLGGVAFSEDVRINGSQWLPFGKPEANTIPTIMQEFGHIQMNLGDRRALRFATGLDFAVPMLEGWQGTSNYVYSHYDNVGQSTQQFSLGAVAQGLNCDVVKDVKSCFNPFGATDARFRTPQHVADAIYTNERVNDRNTLQTFDLMFSGDVPLGGFELPGGPVAMATGYQRREETQKDGPTATSIKNDQLIGVRALPRKVSRSSDSFFVELAFPVLDNLELSAAARDESFSSGQSAVVDKFGLVYVPTDWLSVRATMGEAFIVPTLTQLDSPEVCGLSNVDYLFSSFQGFITSCRTGNPNLTPESSDSLSLGVDLVLLDNLTWSLTWSETDFVDRIVSTTTQDIIRTDYRNFREATGFNPSTAAPFPTLTQLQSWQNDPRSDKRIIPNPQDNTTPDRILQSDSNASSMLVRAWDTQMDYGFSLDDVGLNGLGDIDMQLQATYMDTYSFQLAADQPVREAVGRQNNQFGAVPTTPKIRANLRINWSLGDHTVSTTTRYVDEVIFDANEFSFQTAFPGNEWGGITDKLRTWTQLDMFYSYRGLEVFGSDVNLSVGARNLTDRMPQQTGMIAGVAAESQDVLGRVVYGRVNFNF